jgi:cysteine desulfurase/selenocysteine lyase
VSAIDVARARRETPGSASVVHLNNAGASLMPDVVLATVIEHLELEARIGGYEAAAMVRERVEGVYDSVARLLGCSRDEVAIVENATRAWDMAFYSVDFQPGERILTCGAEYASNYIALLQVSRRTGAIVVVVEDDESGQISLPALEAELGRGARLVSLVHVPSQGGLVQPAAAVGALCRAAGVPLLLDACQSTGQLPTDVGELQCDMLSATGRKFLRGPRGTGFLYVRKDLIEGLEPPFLDLHAAEWTGRETYAIRDDARRFENWETSYATKLGLGVAVDYALEWGLESIAERVQVLAASLRLQLDAQPGVEVRDRGVERCGIVTFTVEGTAAQDVVARLAAAGINVSLTPATYSRLDLGGRGIEAVIRASAHYYNTEEELSRLVAVVAAAGTPR